MILDPTPTCKTRINALYGTDSAPAASAPPLPEAAFSLTLRGTIDGIESMLTVRGQSSAEFHANVAAVRGMLDSRTPASPPAPPPTRAVVTPPPTPDTEGWCELHNVPMHLNDKDGRRWWSHRLPGNTWCKGR